MLNAVVHETAKAPNKIGQGPMLFLGTFGRLNAQCGRSRDRKNAKHKLASCAVLALKMHTCSPQTRWEAQALKRGIKMYI